MKEIIVQHKPDSISWEQLATCHQRAHESNKSEGIRMLCADYSAEELKKEVEKGICLVAIDENKNLLGTLSIVFRTYKSFYYTGDAAYICYVAVSPDYKGKGVYKALSQKANQEISDRGVDMLYLHTHNKNKVAREVYQRDGYKLVRLIATGGGANYYSVEMAKWIRGASPGKIFLNIIYILSCIYIRFRYKPGHVKRFGI